MIEQDTRYKFVPLNRTFHELSKYARESDEADLSGAFHVGKRLEWSDIIQEYRVVILSEAGSGKTEEIRNITQKLHDQGSPAFFIRLEHVPNDFEDAFEIGGYEKFQEWLASGEEGWLFLDSVDEARLRNPGDFELAIRKLGRQISIAKDRAHIVITGRITAWRPKTDLELCAQHLQLVVRTTAMSTQEQTEVATPAGSLRTKERDASQEPPFKIVTLDDLSQDQIELFARAKGVTDTAAFLRAVERAEAWSFTSRPQDLEELTEFWIDQGRIGGRLELMRNSINHRLSERDQDRADAQPLSAQDARQGAKLLAAAATLAQLPTICVPDGADNSKGIPVRELLPDWDDKKQAIFLSRPIFDEAIYGTVRFHHRSVREYLAAEWLADLLSRETSRRKIETLLFQNQYGLDVVVPKLRPVLPWLAILDQKVREWLRKIAPEVIFEGGDPSQLPLEMRRTILYEVCEQMAHGTSNWSVSDYASVQRFSSPDLADDIKSLIGKYSENDELVGFLLRMIWLGEVVAALPEAKAIAFSGSTSIYTRIAAIRAVKATGSDNDVEELRQAFLGEAAELDRDWLAELVQDAKPSSDSITWLLSGLEKSQEKRRFSVDRLTDAVEKFVQATDIDSLHKLVGGFHDLLERSPVIERRHCEISQRFSWLLKPACQAVERLIRERHPTALQPASLRILHKLVTSYDYDADGVRREEFDFSTLVPEWTALNRTLFWHEVEQVRAQRDKKRGERVDDFWRVSMFGAFWRFGSEDFEYATDQIASQTLIDNKLVALSVAFRIYVESGRPRAWREQLKKRVAGDKRLSDRLARYLKPPAQGADARRWKQQEATWKRRAQARERKEAKYHEDWKKWLANNVAKLRDHGFAHPHLISNGQHYLHEQMRKKNEQSTRWTDGDWKSLIDHYGEAIARAFRDGVVAYWRHYKPKLQSEGAPTNSTPFPAIFGLTGIAIEARETADWASSLTPKEIDLACRYASHELNGFPTWFPTLFEKHFQPVGDFLLNEIKYELSTAKRDTEPHYILSDVSWSGEWAWNQIAPSLVDLLSETEPVSLSSLRKILTIVQGSSVPDEQIRELASKKCRSLRRHDHLALWYAIWTGVDPGAAIPALATRIAKMAKPKDRTGFAMNYVTQLSGRRRDSGARVRDAFRTPQHLKLLYLLMHKYIPRKDDINRAGTGVYSPSLRDNAQEARDSLFSILNEIPGKEAFIALGEIANEHPEESSRSRFAFHAKRKAEQDSDIDPWSPKQVHEFHEKLERTPSNHRELAELAVMRLLDLKDDLENGDSSIARILKNVNLETDMRNYLGRELRDKAFGRYSIPQEEELADARKPDLRFHGAGFDSPVPVEIKLADNWTGPDLSERLQNQLCGDYLRDNRSARGIFVLVYRGEKTAWDVPGSTNRVDFAGLVSALHAHWERISSSFPSIDDVVIIGIDLTERSR